MTQTLIPEIQWNHKKQIIKLKKKGIINLCIFKMKNGLSHIVIVIVIIFKMKNN